MIDDLSLGEDKCQIFSHNTDQKLYQTQNNETFCQYCFIFCQQREIINVPKKIINDITKWCECSHSDEELQKHFDSFLSLDIQINEADSIRMIGAINKYFQAQYQFNNKIEQDPLKEEQIQNQYQENSLYSIQAENKDVVIKTYLDLYYEYHNPDLKICDQMQADQQKINQKSSIINWNLISLEAAQLTQSAVRPFEKMKLERHFRNFISDDMLSKSFTINYIFSYINKSIFSPNTIQNNYRSQMFTYITSLLNVLYHQYILKDLTDMNKISSNIIGEVSIISRDIVRKTNRNNKAFKERYMNKEEGGNNIIELLIKVLQKWVFPSNEIYIKHSHMVDTLVLEIVKALSEHQLLDGSLYQEVKQALVDNMPSYKQLEDNLMEMLQRNDEDDPIQSHKVDNLLEHKQSYSDKFSHNQQLFGDFFIQYIYHELDSYFLDTWYSNRDLTLQKQKNAMNINSKFLLYDQPFGQQLMYVVFNYILRQTSISQNHNALFSHFLSIIINPQDMYHTNLSTLTDHDLFNYFQYLQNNTSSNQHTSCTKLQLQSHSHHLFIEFLQQFQELYDDLKKSAFIFDENKGLMRLQFIQTDLLSVLEENQRKDNFKEFQLQLLSTDLFNLLLRDFIILHPFMNEYSQDQQLLSQFQEITLLILSDNSVAYDLMLEQAQLDDFFILFQAFPMVISTLFLKACTEPKDCPALEQLYKKTSFLHFVQKCIEHTFNQQSVMVSDIFWQVQTNLVRIQYVFVKLESLRQPHQMLKEYDLVMQQQYSKLGEKMEKEGLPALISPENLMAFATDSIDNPYQDTYYLWFLTLCGEMFSFQLEHSAFMLFYGPIKTNTIIELITSCNQLNKRVVLLEIYQQVYVCFKNYLVNNRREFQNNKYDTTYLDDPFYDCQYKDQLEFLINEIDFLVDLPLESIDQVSQNHYLEGTFFVIIYKLFSYLTAQNPYLKYETVKVDGKYRSVKKNDMLYLTIYQDLFEQMSDKLITHLPSICQLYHIETKSLSLFPDDPTIPEIWSLKDQYKLFKQHILEMEDLEIKLELLKIRSFSKLNMRIAHQIHLLSDNLDKSEVFRTDEFYDGRDLPQLVNSTSIMFSQREEYLFQLQARAELFKDEGSIGLVSYSAQLYLNNKYEKVSTQVDSNVYLQCLNNGKDKHQYSWQVDFSYSSDASSYCQTLSKYFMTLSQQPGSDMQDIILCFNHILFGATHAMQDGFYANVIRNSPPFRNFLKTNNIFHTAEKQSEIDNEIFRFICQSKKVNEEKKTKIIKHKASIIKQQQSVSEKVQKTIQIDEMGEDEMKSDGIDFDVQFIHIIWDNLVQSILYLFTKCHIDPTWNKYFVQVYNSLNMLIGLVQFDCTRFQVILATTGPVCSHLLKIDAVIQKLNQLTSYNRFYSTNKLEKLTKTNKPYGLLIVVKLIQLSKKGINSHVIEKNDQQLINTSIYKGILYRYSSDIESTLNECKLVIMQYFHVLIAAQIPEVLNAMVVRIELTELRRLMFRSLAQMVNQSIHQIGDDYSSIQEYTLSMNDLSIILHHYHTKQAFREHTLIKLVFIIYFYISSMAGINSIGNQYALYFEEIRLELARMDKQASEGGQPTSHFLYSQTELVAFKFINSVLIQVEISIDSSIRLFHFQKPYKCNFLSDATKTHFERIADRSSDQSKISSLVDNVPYFIMEMDYNLEIAIRGRMWGWLLNTDMSYYLSLLCFILVLIVSIVLLQNSEKNDGKTGVYQGKYWQLVNGLTYAQISLAVLDLLYFLFYQLKLSYYLGLAQLVKKQNLRVTKGHHKVKVLGNVIMDSTAALSFLHIVCPVVGLTYDSTYLSFSMVSFLYSNQMTQNLVKSALLHKAQLLSTLAILLILVYNFTMYTHIYFVDESETIAASDLTGSTGVSETYCFDLNSCFSNMCNLGARDGSGVSTLLSQDANISLFNKHNNVFIAKLFLQVMYFILITVVTLSVFGGIIIDTFSELREKLTAVQQDVEHYCYICCLEQNEFQSQGINFTWHKENNHSLWKYVFLYSHFENKHLTDCHDPIQFYIKKQILNNAVDFFPNHQSLQINALREQEPEEYENNEKASEFSYENYNFVLSQIFKKVNKMEANRSVDIQQL